MNRKKRSSGKLPASRYWFILAGFLAILTACSKDPKPDRATPFIGEWKTDVEDSVWVTFQTFWKIERSGPNMVNIATSDSIVTKVEDFVPPFAIEMPVYNVKIDESGEMILNYTSAKYGVIHTYSGTASIINEKLVAKIQETSNVDGFLSSKTLIFHR